MFRAQAVDRVKHHLTARPVELSDWHAAATRSEDIEQSRSPALERVKVKF
jgi:hypothetical protein